MASLDDSTTTRANIGAVVLHGTSAARLANRLHCKVQACSPGLLSSPTQNFEFLDQL